MDPASSNPEKHVCACLFLVSPGWGQYLGDRGHHMVTRDDIGIASYTNYRSRRRTEPKHFNFADWLINAPVVPGKERPQTHGKESLTGYPDKKKAKGMHGYESQYVPPRNEWRAPDPNPALVAMTFPHRHTRPQPGYESSVMVSGSVDSSEGVMKG